MLALSCCARAAGAARGAGISPCVGSTSGKVHCARRCLNKTCWFCQLAKTRPVHCKGVLENIAFLAVMIHGLLPAGQCTHMSLGMSSRLGTPESPSSHVTARCLQGRRAGDFHEASGVCPSVPWPWCLLEQRA